MKILTIAVIFVMVFGTDRISGQQLTKLAEGNGLSNDMLAKDLLKIQAPNFSLIDQDGKIVSLSDFRGKVVVIDFWATWCKPCIASFPGMQATVSKYKNDKDVKFLFVDTWEQGDKYKEEVKALVEQNNYDFHILFDEMQDIQKSITAVYGVQGIPNKIIIDKEGFIRFQSAGSGRNIDHIVSEMTSRIEFVKHLNK